MSKEEEKIFCIKCGERLKGGLFNTIVYPSSEFKNGYACFFCAKKIREKNEKRNNNTF